MLDTFINLFGSLLHNQAIVVSLLAMLIAQFLKIFSSFIRYKRLDFKEFTSSGGMPSSHTSMVIALTTYLGIKHGFNSEYTAVAMIFSMIVMYDASGVRKAAGKQAAVLNKIVDDLFHEKGFQEERLKEILGHTPLEVIGGFILGVICAYYYSLWIV